MTFRFSMLASGSAGNAALLEADGFGLLIDAGLGPRQLASRLHAVGASWAKVNAVVLTHTHSDHWKDRTLKHLRQLQIPFYCHEGHHGVLHEFAPSYAELMSANLVRSYEPEKELRLGPIMRCQPFEVRHDSYPTFGFRIEGHDGLFGPTWAVAYAADLGCWTPSLADHFANADVLALEFNHDERLERNSRRPADLVARVLSDDGHLSNEQAADFVQAILDRSDVCLPAHLIQLHLSRECNRSALAQSAVRKVLDASVTVHTAEQDRVGPVLTLDIRRKPVRSAARVSKPISRLMQPSLPGMAD
jgi:phosphoribosyl 1,2-cyclic phosphodiesterase